MSVYIDIVKLGRALEEAEAKIERAKSLEQAIDESGQRLRKLRLEEGEVNRALDAARERAHQLEEGAKVQAQAILDASYAESGKRRKEFEQSYRSRVEGIEKHLADQGAEAKRRAAAIAKLEAEETRLAQSVTALKAELEALRAKFN